MLCIFAFIIFLILFPILGFFPSYRRLFARSWECVFKRITLRPCDINLGEELKNQLLGTIVFKYPKFTRFLDKTFSFWAFLFVVLNIWSLLYVMVAGVNLLVYDTCDPVSGEGCSLSGDACGVAQETLDFSTAVAENKILDWAAQPFTSFGQTVAKIPDRFKNWDASNYITGNQTYYNNQRTDKPLTLEIVDPSCVSCKRLFQNIKESGFTNKYDLTYIAYPIPKTDGGYRFPYSYKITSLLEATKKIKPAQPKNSNVPADWQVLEIIYTREGKVTNTLQDDFNYAFNAQQAESKLKEILAEIGYNNQEMDKLFALSQTQEIKNIIAEHKKIVEEKIKTIKIPTIIFNGRRFDRVVDVKDLK